MIKMGLVTLLLDSGPKLAVGMWIAWWSGLPGGSRSRRKLETLKLSNGEQATKGWDHFYGGIWPLKAQSKDFNLAIVGGLGWMKCLKNGAGKCLYCMRFSLYTLLLSCKIVKEFETEN